MEIPRQVPEEVDETFLESVHRVLMEVYIFIDLLLDTDYEWQDGVQWLWTRVPDQGQYSQHVVAGT
jgi:hypothetical protein